MILSLLPGTALAAGMPAEGDAPVLPTEKPGGSSEVEDLKLGEELPDKPYNVPETPPEADSEPVLYASSGRVAYPVTGGNLYFDPVTGAIADCDRSVISAVIPSSIDGVAVTSIGSYAFDNCSSLTSITIPDSVTSIGYYAFNNCSNLTSADIPSSVISIEDYAFSSCDRLTSITIPDSVTSIGERAFWSCSSLTSLTIGSGVTSIETQTFYNCRSLTSVTIPDSVTSIGWHAFESCTNLTSITIPDSVTSIGTSAFYDCKSLTSVSIPSSVTNIRSGAFRGCTSLTDVYYGGSESQWEAISIESGNDPLLTAEIHKEAYDVTLVYGNGAKNTVTPVKSGEKFTFPADPTWSGYDFLGWDGQYKANDEVTVTAHVTYTAVWEESDFIIKNGVLTGYKGSGGDVTIPDGVTSIKYKAFYYCRSLTSVTIPDSVTSIEGYAFYNCDRLTSVIIGSSVTSIGEWAFYTCTGLTSITIPDSVTSIDNYAFYNCDGLTSVTIPDSVTSIGESAFFGCNKLAEVYYSGSKAQWDEVSIRADNGCLTSATLHVDSFGPSGICGGKLTWTWENGVLTISGSGLMRNYEAPPSTYSQPWYSIRNTITAVKIEYGVTSVGNRAFNDCSNLITVDIPDSVTSIGDYAFNNCSNLTSADIPNSVTSIGDYAFYNCGSLTDVTIPSSVTSIGKSAFSYSALESMTIPSSVTSIGELAFSHSALKSVTIPSSVTRIGNAFSGCEGLASISIPESVTTIDKGAFSDCIALADVYYRGSKEQWEAISIGSGNDPLLTAEIHYNSTWLEVGPDLSDFIIKNGVLTGYKGSGGDVTIPDGVTSIGDGAFYGCTSLTSVSIPDGVTSIGRNAFQNCSSLTSVTIPDSVTSIGSHAFYNCASLTSVSIPSSVTDIGSGAFSACISLTAIQVDSNNQNFSAVDGVLFNHTMSILKAYPAGKQGAYTIPDGVLCIGECAFSGCTSLTSVTIPDSVTSIFESAFEDCTNLTSVSLPSSVTSIFDGAFYNCTSLTSVSIPSSVTGIGYWVFGGCTGLTAIQVDPNNQNFSAVDGVLFNRTMDILLAYPAGKQGAYTIPDSVTIIEIGAFRCCESLTGITIPNSVTFIKYDTFFGCTSLTSVSIPSSVTSIGIYAFDGCTSLTDVYYDGSRYQWGTIDIEDENDPLLNAKIHYNSSMSVKGTLGDAAELKWTYDKGTNRITVDGDAVNTSEPIYVAVYDQDGRMTGLFAIIVSGAQVSVGSDFSHIKLVWVDENTAPKCTYAEITENGNS